MQFDKIFFIAVFGSITLRTYRTRSKTVYAEPNSQKYFIEVLLFGLPAHLIFHIYNALFCIPGIFSFVTRPQPASLIETALVYFPSSIFVGVLLSCKPILLFQKFIRHSFKGPNVKPRTNGLVEGDLAYFMHKQMALLISLKNGKVYIGMVKHGDFIDGLSPDLRAIKIVPFKSGERKITGEVVFQTHYLEMDLDEYYELRRVLYKDNPTEEEDLDLWNALYEDALSEIPDLVIFQREIISYSIYDEDLDVKFHNETSLLARVSDDKATDETDEE